MKMDMKQGYGHIVGGHGGAVFEQNGRMFDAEGDEVVVAVVPEDPAGEEQGTVPEVTVTKVNKSHKKKVIAPVAQASPVDIQLAAQGL